MEAKHRNLLIGCGSIAFVVMLLVAGAVWFLYSRFERAFELAGSGEIPAGLRDPRVVSGAGLFSRDTFLNSDERFSGANSIGAIEDIHVDGMGHEYGGDVVIAGRFGAVTADLEGTNALPVQFRFEPEKGLRAFFRTEQPRPSLGDMQVVDLEGDNRCEFLARGSFDGTALFDSRGRQLWSYGKYSRDQGILNDVTAGDLDGDGLAELVVAREGIEVFDLTGTQLWRQYEQSTIYHVVVCDADGDGKNEIVSGAGDLVIRNASGQIIRQYRMPVYLTQFSVLATNRNRKRQCLLTVDHRYTWLFSTEGETLARFDALPLSRETGPYKTYGTWVNLVAGEMDYLAVVTRYGALDRSILYVYAASGKLVYQEVLGERCSSIAALPRIAGEGGQAFLVGGEHTVWRYRWKAEPASQPRPAPAHRSRRH